MPSLPKPPMSSYDPRFGEGKQVRPADAVAAPKVIKEQPKAERVVGGCGDPNCPLCNPPNTPPGEINTSSAPSAGMPATRGATTVVSLTPDGDYNKARAEVAEYILETEHSLLWSDVIGNEKARTALLEAIEHPVLYADLYKHYDMKPTKGVLLMGPPGCGKTMFGKAAAAALGRLYNKKTEMLVINGPSIQTPWVGETEKIIRNIFDYARHYKRIHGHQLVIFIDEADAILRARKGGPMWNASNVATFLTEMDGMENSGAFVILATNRPEELDEALLRDGRCDRKIVVKRPDEKAALHIVHKELARGKEWRGNVHEKDFVDYLFAPDHLIEVMINPVTLKHHHFTLAHIVSGAMMVGLVSRAKGIAFRRDLASGKITSMTVADVRQAIDEVFAENCALNHDYAKGEFIKNIALPSELDRAAAA